MIKKYKVFGFSLALSAAIYFFLFGQENFQKLNFQKDLQLNFIDNASFEEKKNKIDSIINLSSNNPAQVYFLANYLFDKTEYALASRTLEHFILNFPNDTDAEVMALTAETKYLSNNQIFNDGVIEYEGHDVPANINPEKKLVDQSLLSPSGTPTENGKFFQAALDYKHGLREPSRIQVYRKLRKGIWVDMGFYDLIDAYEKK